MIVPDLNPYRRTYQIVAPKSTHFRPATCEEVGCAAWRNGWKTIVPSNSDQALYIRSGSSGRRHVESTSYGDAGKGMTEFIFEAGQRCFGASEHRVSLEREPLFRVKDGRGPAIAHTRGELWVEDMSHHLDRIRNQGE